MHARLYLQIDQVQDKEAETDQRISQETNCNSGKAGDIWMIHLVENLSTAQLLVMNFSNHVNSCGTRF